MKIKTLKNTFIKIAQKTQAELKSFVAEELKENGYDVCLGDGYVYAQGTEPYLLTAHLDTVHEKPRGIPKTISVTKNKEGQTVISSPQGIGADDRAGVTAILEIIKKFHVSVLFCEDEEIGSVGAGKFANTKHVKDLEKLNYLIEIDRRGSNDAVFYSCGNENFKRFIEDNTDFIEAQGTWSDICELSPACDVASVNFSSGYYDEHHVEETLVVEELAHTIKQIEKLLCIDSEQFDYQEYDPWLMYNKDRNYGCWYDEFDRYDGYEVFYKDKDKVESDYHEGVNIYEALGKFFIDNPEISYQDILDLQQIY